MPHRNPSQNSAKRKVQSALSATAILVLGMHRSGTSAIARVLNLRGADLGRDLLPAKQDNERGFWENAEILGLHERFLGQQQWQWHDLLTPAAAWQHDPPAREFVARLPAVLEQQYGDSNLLLIKDPRLSLLASLWIETLAGLKMRPVFVITIRHPDEVAASLARRDGFASARSRWLWLQYLVEAERATRGHPRVFVHYERLLADWRGELERIGTQLGIAWPAQPADFDSAVTRFIAPALRHHRGSEGDSDAALPAVLRRVYERACAAASDAVPAAAGFDGVLAGFDDWMQLAAPLHHDLILQQEGANAQHAAEIDKARAALAIHENEIAQARANIDALAAEIGEARTAFSAKEAEVDAARVNIETLNVDLNRSRDTIAAKDREIDAARQNIDTRTNELALARDNIHALTVEISRARESFALKEQELDAARHALTVLQDALASKEREIDAARTNIDALVAQIDAARRNIDNLVAEIECARQAHGARDAADAALRQTLWYRLGRSLRLIGGGKP